MVQFKDIKVLWIEEETATAVSDRKSFAKASKRIDLTIIETSEDAKAESGKLKDYHVIIIDIRIPENRSQLKAQSGSTISAHYQKNGLEIVEFIHTSQMINKVFIFTNESWDEVKGELTPFDIKETHFLSKKDCRSDKMFERYIMGIYEKTL